MINSEYFIYSFMFDQLASNWFEFSSVETSNVGDLKIARIDKVTGSCSGHEEVFIFVEQVNKSMRQTSLNIQQQFMVI